MPEIKPFTKVRELLEKIRADRKPIVLASPANSDELEVYKKIARIEDLIEDETSANDVKNLSPNMIFLMPRLKNSEKSMKKCRRRHGLLMRRK